jgi:type VI secretion system protein ImpE
MALMQGQTTQQAKALYDAGQLGPALEALTREVKANPADQQRRAFLFELLCFAGEWERAGKQLDVIGHQSATSAAGVQVYRNCISAELARRRLFTDGLAPHFLAEPPSYVDLHLEAINRLRAGDADGARETLDRAEELRPALAGSLNGRPFQDFRDYDDFFGPALELIVSDKYVWLPFEQLRSLRAEPPAQLRDLVWVPASIETAERELKAFVPALYADSGSHPNDLVRLGRMTDWKQRGEELYMGAGLRLFAVDGEETPVLGLREVEFSSPDEPPAGADAGAPGAT